jgi:hypothetical protein
MEYITQYMWKEQDGGMTTLDRFRLWFWKLEYIEVYLLTPFQSFQNFTSQQPLLGEFITFKFLVVFDKHWMRICVLQSRIYAWFLLFQLISVMHLRNRTI